MITIEPVTGGRLLQMFKRVPDTVYRDDPDWLGGDVVDLGALICGSSAQARQRAEVQAFVARDGAIPVGRIVAIADHPYIAYRQERTAFFGFYEAIEDRAVSTGLFDAAAAWARRRSLDRVLGPMNPSMNHSAGVMVRSCERVPLIGMLYNPGYYSEQLEAWGMQPVKDLHSYLWPDVFRRLEDKRRMWDRWRSRSAVRFRSLDMARFDDEVELIRQIYNAAFARYWGFSPIDREAFHELAYGFRPVLDADLIVIGMIGERAIGFVVAIPDVNQALAKAMRWRGRIARTMSALWHTRGPGRRTTIRNVRADMLGVHPACPDRGVAGLMIFELLRRVHVKGYAAVETAPVFPDTPWLKTFRAIRPDGPHRIYRIYGRDL